MGYGADSYYELNSPYAFWGDVETQMATIDRETQADMERARGDLHLSAVLTPFVEVCGANRGNCGSELVAAFDSVDSIPQEDLSTWLKLIGPYQGVFQEKPITFVAIYYPDANISDVAVKDGKVAILQPTPTWQDESVDFDVCGSTAWTSCSQPSIDPAEPLGFALYDVSDYQGIVVGEPIELQYQTKRLTVNFKFASPNVDPTCPLTSLVVQYVSSY